MKDLQYKGYVGSAEADFEDNILFGRLLFIKDLVSYQAETPTELRQAFEEAVDDYLRDCAEQGLEPDVPFKGQFNVRVTPKLHRSLAVSARAQGKTMNVYVGEVLNCHESVGENGQIQHPEVKTFVVLGNDNISGGSRVISGNLESSFARQEAMANWATLRSDYVKH